MNDRRRQDDWRAEGPPNSRLFIVCDKALTAKEIEEAFSPFGEITKLLIPKDHKSGEPKGIAFITYSKTSEAAKALTEMSSKKLGSQGKSVKVMIASNKDEDGDIVEDNLKRLFVISKTATEKELNDYFSQFGKIDAIHLLRNRDTDQLKGFAFILFDSFLSAAKAFEGSDKMYKAVFAKPRDSLKRRSFYDNGYNDSKYSRPSIDRDYYESPNNRYSHPSSSNMPSCNKSDPEEYTSVKVKCSPQLSHNHIMKLFNIIPGMTNCNYSYEGAFGSAIVTYDNHTSAAHAVQRLNQFEYPLGDMISVVPESLLTKVAYDLTNIVQNFKDAMTSGNGVPDLKSLADAMSQASSLLKSASVPESRRNECDRMCSVKLPPPQPLASNNSECVRRCFIVCVPEPLPSDILYDIFGRFGDLKTVHMLPQKNYGFANYASINAAEDAKKTLHGALVANIRLKVLDAEDKGKGQDS